MNYLVHKKIKTFTQDIVVADSSRIERSRDEVVRLMTADMRDAGYIPVLDIGISQSSSMNYETGHFDVTVSVYGVFVGKEKSWLLEGVELSNLGKTYPLVSPGTKINS